MTKTEKLLQAFLDYQEDKKDILEVYGLLYDCYLTAKEMEVLNTLYDRAIEVLDTHWKDIYID